VDRRRASNLAAVLFAATVATVTAADEVPWWSLPDDAPARTALGNLRSARAVAVARGGRPAVAAYPAGKNGTDSRVVVLDGGDGDAREFELPGEVRAVRVVGETADVVLVVARRGKRRPPETHLVALDLATLRTRRLLHLPHTTADVAEADDGTLVVACRDELRTFAYPALTSGPLYRLLGDNRAVVHLRGPRFVVANERGVVLLDLTDPPGKDEMPVRATFDPGGAIAGLGVLDDRSRVSILPAGDGDPIEWAIPDVPARPGPDVAEPEPRPGAVPTAAATEPPDRTSSPEPAAPAPDPGSREAAEPEREPEPEPEPGAPAEPGPTGVAAAEPAIASDSVPAPVPVSEPEATAEAPRATAPAATPPAAPVSAPPPAPAPEPVPTSVAAPATEEPGPAPSLRGTISGDRADAVRWVVAFGPDNVFRESARVAPGPDGSYRFDRLPAGSYRLVLDGGGDRVVESDPAFRIVRVDDAGGATVPPFVVVRVR